MKKCLTMLQREMKMQGVNFILCMGDDIQDEKMFNSIFSFVAESEDVEYVITLPNEEDSDMIHIPQD